MPGRQFFLFQAWPRCKPVRLWQAPDGGDTFGPSKRFWTGAFRATPDPALESFNTKIGAGRWANFLFMPLETPAPGTYVLDVAERLSHTTTDMLVPVGEPSRHPIMFKPYVDSLPTGTFTIAP
jgi:hypothetical protein